VSLPHRRSAPPVRRPAGASRLRSEANRADDAGRERAARVRHRSNVGWRIAIVGLLVMMVFALTFPTMRLFLAERQKLESVRAEVEVEAEVTEELKAQLRRWSDPAYVQAQARSRLSYVQPGDVAFKVVDPENAPTPSTAASPSGSGVLDIRSDGSEVAEAVPWYTALWDSVVAAGG
jgi:cell division protein FtsB